MTCQGPVTCVTCGVCWWSMSGPVTCLTCTTWDTGNTLPSETFPYPASPHQPTKHGTCRGLMEMSGCFRQSLDQGCTPYNSHCLWNARNIWNILILIYFDNQQRFSWYWYVLTINKDSLVEWKIIDLVFESHSWIFVHLNQVWQPSNVEILTKVTNCRKFWRILPQTRPIFTQKW